MTWGLRSDPSACASREHCDCRRIYNCLGTRKTELPLQMSLSSPCVNRLVYGPVQRLNGCGGLGWLHRVRGQPIQGKHKLCRLMLEEPLWDSSKVTTGVSIPEGFPSMCIPEIARGPEASCSAQRSPRLRERAALLEGILKGNTQQCSHSSRAHLTNTVTLRY